MYSFKVLEMEYNSSKINCFSGVTGIEVLLGHVTCQLLVMIFQTAAVVGVTFWLFNLTIQGSVFTASVLVALTGLCGMCFGRFL